MINTNIHIHGRVYTVLFSIIYRALSVIYRALFTVYRFAIFMINNKHTDPWEERLKRACFHNT